MHVGHPFSGEVARGWRRRTDLSSVTHYHHPFLGNVLVQPSHRGVSSASRSDGKTGAGWKIIRGGRFTVSPESTPGPWAVTASVNPTLGDLHARFLTGLLPPRLASPPIFSSIPHHAERCAQFRAAAVSTGCNEEVSISALGH